MQSDFYKQRQKESDYYIAHTLKRENQAQLQQMQEVERLRKQLSGRGAVTPISDEVAFGQNLRLDKAISDLHRLGLEASDVDRIFGSTSASVDQFTTRVDLLTGANRSAIASFRELIDTQQLLVGVFNAVAGAIAGAVAGTESFGRALLAGVLSAIGQLAITLGQFFLLAAAGFAFIPGLQWSSWQLAAAGTAMLAFGATLVGLASRLQQQNQQQGAAGAASGGAGASSGGGAARGSGTPPTTTVDLALTSSAARINELDRRINRLSQMEHSSYYRVFASAERERAEIERNRLLSSQGIPQIGGGSRMVNVIQLDREGTKDFLNGHEVVTRKNATNTMRETLKKATA